MGDVNRRNIATIISSILISNTRRMTIRQLSAEFEQTEGYRIPYQKFGCATLEQFLRTLNDKVVVYGSGMYAEVQVIVSSKTAHINDLVSKQRDPKHKKPSRYSGNHKYVAPVNRRNFTIQRNDFTPPVVPSSSNNVIPPSVPSHRPPVISNSTQARPPDNPLPSQSARPSPPNTTEPARLDSANKGAVPKSPTYQNESSSEDTLYFSDEDDTKNTKVPKMVQDKLWRLIAKHPDGILCSNIVELYRKQYNETLSYSDYGYRSIAQMCVELRRVFNIVQLDKSEIKLFDKRKPIPQDSLNIAKKLQRLKMMASAEAPAENALPEAGVEEIMSEIYSDKTPPNVLECGAQLEQQWIDPGTSEQDFIDVNVGEVYDPSKFWINLVHYVPKLNNLMNSMQNFYALYKMDLLVPYYALKNDLYIACIYDKEYHRARIVDASQKNDSSIKVYFVDYGTVAIVPNHSVCYLHNQFADLPTQAIRARLAGICPATINEQWSRSAAARFLSLVMQKDLLAQIVRIDEEKKILDIVMADTNEDDEDFFINDALVAMDYACFTFQERKPAEEADIVPIVRYIHLFPTHYELENGLVPSALRMIYMHQEGFAIEQIYPHYFKDAKTGLPFTPNHVIAKKDLPVDYDIERRYCEAYAENYNDEDDDFVTNDDGEESASTGVAESFVSPTGTTKSHWEDIIDEAESVAIATVGDDSNDVASPTTSAPIAETNGADELSEKIRNVVRQFIEKECSPTAANNTACTQTDGGDPYVDTRKQSKANSTKTKVYQTNTFTQINVASSSTASEDPPTDKPIRPPPGYSHLPANRNATPNANANSYVTNQTFINFPVHYNQPYAFAPPIGYLYGNPTAYPYNNSYNHILRNIQHLISCGYRLTPEQQNYLQSFNWGCAPAYLPRENFAPYTEAPPRPYPETCASAQNFQNAHHNPKSRQELREGNSARHERTGVHSLNPIAATFVPDRRATDDLKNVVRVDEAIERGATVPDVEEKPVDGADISKSDDQAVRVDEDTERGTTVRDVKEEKSVGDADISTSDDQAVRVDEKTKRGTTVRDVEEEKSVGDADISTSDDQAVRVDEEVDHDAIVPEEKLAVTNHSDSSAKREVIESENPLAEMYAPTISAAHEEIACDATSNDGSEANTNESRYSENGQAENTLAEGDDGEQKTDENEETSNVTDEDRTEREDHEKTIVSGNNDILEVDSVYEECDSNSIYSDSYGTKLIMSISIGKLNLHVVCLETEYYFLLSELSMKIFSKSLTALHIRKLFVASPCTVSIVDIRLKKHPELKKELLMYDLIKEAETTVDGVPIKYFEELIKVIPMAECAHAEVTSLLKEIDCLLSEHCLENKY